MDLIVESIMYMFHNLQEKEKLIRFLDKLPDFYMNLDKILVYSDSIDKDLYLQIENILYSGYELNKTVTKQICETFFTSFTEKYPFDKFIYSIALFRDFLPNFYQLALDTPMNKFAEEFSNILFQMIEDKKEEDFQFYFFDWTLKFGYLIEGYIKEILIFQLKLHYLLTNQKEEYETLINTKLTVGQALKILEADKTLAVYRNAIFHTSFILDYNVNLQERKVIFIDLYDKKEELSIENFIGTFFRLFQVIQTYILALAFFSFKIHKEQIYSVLVKQFNTFKKQIDNWNYPNKKDPKELSKLKEEIKQQLKNLNI